jgi:hypothetical protein
MFKVGDRVRVVTTQVHGTFNKLGKVVEVSEDPSHLYRIRVKIEGIGPNWSIYNERELEYYINGIQAMIEVL